MKINIRPFRTEQDLNFAEMLTQAENWRSETRQELEIFFHRDPSGCLIAELDGKPQAICITTAYEKFGFIGELIVAPAARNIGVGRKLMETAIHHLAKKNITDVYLDGVKKAVPLYERLGFQQIERSLRFFGQVQALHSTKVHPITENEFPEIAALDTLSFQGDRTFFLKSRLTHYPHLCYYLENNGKIISYLFGREGRGGWTTVGPWVSTAPVEDSVVLLQHFQNQIGNQPFSIGVLERKKAVIQRLVYEGLIPQPDPPTRMGFTDQLNPGAASACFAIGSPAKG